ncbi:acyl-CoA thioesterase [Lederbergia citrea]|uniref:Acyl-CoA thioesterase n=1 Tax=Lederbergia citrea TaxID=2833581 RepID=A0A942UNF5_9BACI|nr:acyl-CoA thioesterase [Lederbergia citrea]MBS4179241.1 acyl-CoA thioesterase [Lederbergia citrea]MBS4205905.1 acyl-CoA thioesterase [Lederbergia citrea]MBS4224646.1 acyl-CoA thioesterase [Lederbergia citrea]
MEQPTKKFMKETVTIKTSHVLPPDTNHHGTLFGGKLMSYIDDVASIAAVKFARNMVVTASTDSVDFIKPIRTGDAVTLKAMVTWTGRSSMEVFVKITSEHLLTGEQSIAALSFLTFVALDDTGKPTPVPEVVPETEEERWLNETASSRAAHRKIRKQESKDLAAFFSNNSINE